MIHLKKLNKIVSFLKLVMQEDFHGEVRISFRKGEPFNIMKVPSYDMAHLPEEA